MYEDLVKRLRAVTDGSHEDKCDGCPYDEDYPCCVDCLDTLHKQAADAIEELGKPVVRGRWVKDKQSLWSVAECSVCGDFTVETGSYCPNCGAEMENPT